MSQFKKAILKNILVKKKKKMILLLNQSNRLVQPKMNQKILFLMQLCWKKNHHLHQCLQLPVFTGKYCEIPLDTQDLDKEEFNPKITSSSLPG